ncbi:MAG: IPExxxVDY family protein [Cytophagaceae bacterium]
MKAIRLVVDYDYDFELLAFISPEKDYKVAWNINKLLNINLRRDEDLCLEFGKTNKLIFSNFTYDTEYAGLRLLRNRSFDSQDSKPFLLPELKEYDYIIKTEGEKGIFNVNQISEKLKSLPLIQYIRKIEIHTLKSKENLIF